MSGSRRVAAPRSSAAWSSRLATGSPTRALRRGSTSCDARSSSSDYRKESEKLSIGSQDITDVIKSRLKDFKAELVTSEVGRIISVGDGIAQIYGLQGAMAGGVP